MKFDANIAVYACDSRQSGTEIGPETQARCDGAINLIINSGFKTTNVILGAGKDPKLHDSLPLKRLMAKYFQSALKEKRDNEKPTERSSLSISLPGDNSVWGTFKETRAIISSLEYAKPDKLFVVTSQYHMRRVLYIWNALDTGIEVIPIRISYDPGYYNKLLEHPKMIKAFCNVHLES